MSNGPGTPPNGESAPVDVAPLSRPVEASDLDDGWLDTQEPAGSPVEANVPPASSKDEPTTPVHVAVAADAAEPSPVEDQAQTVANTEPQRDAKPTTALDGEAVAKADEGTVGELTEPAAKPAVASGDKTDEPPMQTAAVFVEELVATQQVATPASEQSAEEPFIDVVVSETAEIVPKAALDQNANKSAETAVASELASPGESAAANIPGKDPAPKVGGLGGASLVKSKTRYVVAATAVLASGLILLFAWPKQAPKSSPVSAEPSMAPVMPVVAPAASGNALQERATASAEPSASAAQAAAPPLATAAASAAQSASATSGESFLDAFHKNAARKDAKWAEVKPLAGKADKGTVPSNQASPAKPAAAKPAAAKPAAADPLDVLKRLEEARKNKKP